ncbi:zinc finger protein 687a-like [Liolophura sinensis]|uniref:zinc finger protein 687a-like n=1 Tax=Liolophura sinensis TaxID=3198878 RepID=UPI0031589C43
MATPVQPKDTASEPCGEDTSSLQPAAETLGTPSDGQQDVLSDFIDGQTSVSLAEASISPYFTIPLSTESTACVSSENTTVTQDNAVAVLLDHSVPAGPEQITTPVENKTSAPPDDPVAALIMATSSTPYNSTTAPQARTTSILPDHSLDASANKATFSAVAAAPDKTTYPPPDTLAASLDNATEKGNTCVMPHEDISHISVEKSSQDKEISVMQASQDGTMEHTMTTLLANENSAPPVTLPVPVDRSSPASSDYQMPAALDKPTFTQTVQTMAAPSVKESAPLSDVMSARGDEGTPELSEKQTPSYQATPVPSAYTLPPPAVSTIFSASFLKPAFVREESHVSSSPDMTVVTALTETKTDCLDKALSSPLADTSPLTSDNGYSVLVDVSAPQDVETLSATDEAKPSAPESLSVGDQAYSPLATLDETSPMQANTSAPPEKSTEASNLDYPDNLTTSCSAKIAVALGGKGLVSLCTETPALPGDTLPGPSDTTPAISDATDVTPPDETDVIRPDETDVTRPDETYATPPDETDVTPPDETDVTRPDKTDVTPSDETHVTRPDKTDVTRPDKTDVTPSDETHFTPPGETDVTTPDETYVIPPDETTQASHNITGIILDKVSSHQQDHALVKEVLPVNLTGAKPEISPPICKPTVSLDSSPKQVEMGISATSVTATRPLSATPPGEASYAPIASMARMLTGGVSAVKSSSQPQPSSSVSGQLISATACLPQAQPVNRICAPLDKASSREPVIDALKQKDRSAVTLCSLTGIKRVPSELIAEEAVHLDKPVIVLDESGISRDSVNGGANRHRIENFLAESRAVRLDPDDSNVEMENSEENNLVRSIFCLSKPAEPVPQTSLGSGHSSNVVYSVPSEAERQEEMLAMRRDCVVDPTCVIPNSSLRALPEPDRGLNSNASLVKTKTFEKPSAPIAIKKEPQDTSETSASVLDSDAESSIIPNYHVQNDNTTLTRPSNDVSSNSVLFTDMATGMEISGNSASVTDNNASQASDKGTTTTSALPSLFQSKFSTLREQQLDCLSKTDSTSPYTPPAVPEKLKDKFSGSTFKCIGCEDSFLFASSLEFHLNRKSMQIVCKHERCQAEVKVFTNRCAFASHLKTHGTRAENVDFTVSAASSEMLDKFPDMVRLCDSKSADGMGFSAHWKCMECDLLLPSAEALASHFVPKTDSGLEGGECETCKKHFWTKCSLSAHGRTHSREKPYICPECGQQFLGTWDAFSNHLGLKCFHTCRTSTFKCPRCNLSLASCDEMVEHLISHKETYFKCPNCPMAFKTHSSLLSHVQSAHIAQTVCDTFIFKCAVCDTVFRSENQMVGHTNAHVIEHNKIPKCSFACWFCKQLCDEKQLLEKHLSSAHNVVPSPIICDLCGEHLKSIESFFRHLERHEEMDLPICVVDQSEIISGPPEELAKSLKKKKNSVKKVKSPTRMAKPGVRMFHCSVCEFHCIKSCVAEVHAHIIKHRQEGIFLCPICYTAKLDDLTDLRRHQFLCRKKKNSSKGSPKSMKDSLMCCKCDKTFYTDEDLENHMLSEHAMGPQFPCHLCGLTYDTRNNLQQHIQVIHEGKKNVYLCWICQSKNIKRTFTIAPKLTKHLITKHRVPRNTIDPEKFPRLLPGLDDKDMVVPGSSKRSGGIDTNKAPIKRLKVVGDVVFNCAKCKFSSEDKDEFKTHIKEHKTETDSKQCPECGLCFSVLPSLKKHLIMVHKIEDVNKYVEASSINETAGPEALPVKSDVASSELEASQDMDIGNPLECRVCYKTFDTVALLKSHMRTHGMAFIRSKRCVVNAAN